MQLAALYTVLILWGSPKVELQKQSVMLSAFSKPSCNLPLVWSGMRKKTRNVFLSILSSTEEHQRKNLIGPLQIPHSEKSDREIACTCILSYLLLCHLFSHTCSLALHSEKKGMQPFWRVKAVTSAHNQVQCIFEQGHKGPLGTLKKTLVPFLSKPSYWNLT